MNERTIRQINGVSFLVCLVAIGAGVMIGILGVWGVIPREQGVLWKVLVSDGILFAGGVLTNLAIACYRAPGGRSSVVGRQRQ